MKWLLVVYMFCSLAMAQEAKIETIGAAVELSIDGYTTQQLQEANPFIRWANRGPVGQSSVSSLGFFALIESRRILSVNHPSFTKWAMRSFLVGYGYNDVRQVRLMRRR